MSEVLTVHALVVQPDGSRTGDIYPVDSLPAASDLLNDPSVQEGIEGTKRCEGHAVMVWASPEAQIRASDLNATASFYAGQSIYGPAVVFSAFDVVR